ncbi:MAG: PilZ domain-containing protein [Planctomycetes bacterium]|nr:PilZ domain-containing protein [Planctomycetota bacterium]
MQDLVCKKCASDIITRSVRDHWIDEVLEMCKIFAFRCQLCTKRFYKLLPGYDSEMGEDECREFIRFPAEFPILVEGETLSEPLKGRALNFSMEGCAIRTYDKLDIGKIYSVQLYMQIEGQEHPIKVACQIIRRIDDLSVVFRYVNLSDDNRTVLGDYFKNLYASMQDQKNSSAMNPKVI